MTSEVSFNVRAAVGGSEEYKEKAKAYLCRQLHEYTATINKLKRKHNLVNGLFISLIVTSSTECASAAGLALPYIVSDCGPINGPFNSGGTTGEP